MFKALFGGEIHGRVMDILKTRIANAEQQHQEECTRIDEEHKALVARLEDQRDGAKDAHADSMVDKILGH